MKRLFPLLVCCLLLAGSCTKGEKSTWEQYREWRDVNNDWLLEMQQRTNPDGTPYYKVVVPKWNPGSYILMHYFNDRSETEGNLSPLYSSTVDTRYMLYLCNDVPCDSSTNLTTHGPGIYRSRVSTNIQGWAAALMEMRCGDTAEVVLPYGVAYGAQSIGSIPPYSALRFNVRLVDIPYYEASPY